MSSWPAKARGRACRYELVIKSPENLRRVDLTRLSTDLGRVIHRRYVISIT